MSRKGSFALLMVNSCWKWQIRGLGTFICDSNSRFYVEFAWRLVCMTSTECACLLEVNINLQCWCLPPVQSVPKPEDMTYRKIFCALLCEITKPITVLGDKQVLENDSEFLCVPVCLAPSQTPDHRWASIWIVCTVQQMATLDFSLWVAGCLVIKPLSEWLSVCRGTFPKPPVLSWTKVPLFFHSSPLSPVSR